MPCHSIMKLASNNGQKLLFFPLIYGNHKSCGVICPLTKHLMNPVNALKECRIVNPIESNFIFESNRSEFVKIALESIFDSRAHSSSLQSLDRPKTLPASQCAYYPS